jgi:hypothetical protein
MNYEHKYRKYKAKYLKSKQQEMSGGGIELHVLGKDIALINAVDVLLSNPGTPENDKEIYKLLDQVASDFINSKETVLVLMGKFLRFINKKPAEAMRGGAMKDDMRNALKSISNVLNEYLSLSKLRQEAHKKKNDLEKSVKELWNNSLAQSFRHQERADIGQHVLDTVGVVKDQFSKALASGEIEQRAKDLVARIAQQFNQTGTQTSEVETPNLMSTDK